MDHYIFASLMIVEKQRLALTILVFEGCCFRSVLYIVYLQQRKVLCSPCFLKIGSEELFDTDKFFLSHRNGTTLLLQKIKLIINQLLGMHSQPFRQLKERRQIQIRILVILQLAAGAYDDLWHRSAVYERSAARPRELV